MNFTVGTVFGKLTVVECLPKSESKVQCSCGEVRIVTDANLKAGRSKSCGCTRLGSPYVRHYLTTIPENKRTYNAWINMNQRCYNANGPEWHNYGGRGISVCEKWRSSFPNFLSDMGLMPVGYSLERKDVNGNYCKENCKWIPEPLQTHNKRVSRKVILDGEVLPLKVACRKANISWSTVNMHRLRKGVSAQQALDFYLSR